MSKSWDEIKSERSSIPIEQIQAEAEAAEARWQEEQFQKQKENQFEKVIDGMQYFIWYGTLIIISIAALIYIKKNINILKHKPCKEEPVKIMPLTQKSMRWSNFLIKWAIPATLILSPISLIGNIYSYSNYTNLTDYFINHFEGLQNAINIIVYLFLLIILYLAYKNLKQFSTLGYQYIMYFYVGLFIYPIISIIIYSTVYNISYLINLFMPRIIVSFLFAVANIVYFKKRKHLFFDKGKEIQYEY